MDYVTYYKLSLKETFSGDFPEMSSQEFDSLCSLPHVPEALKACYLVLGRTRICSMQYLLTPVRELYVADGMLIFAHLDELRSCALREEDLKEENPMVFCLAKESVDSDKTIITNHFATDEELRLSRMLTLLMERAGEGAVWRMETPLRSRFQWWRDSFMLKRNTLRIGYIVSALWLFAIKFFGVQPFLRARSGEPFYDALMTIAGLSVIAAFLTLLMGATRFFQYRNIWLSWNDNVRLTSPAALEVQLLRELAMTFFRWNQSEFWNSESGRLFLNCSIALRGSSYRYIQGRYDFIPDSDGILSIPGFPDIQYRAGKRESILFRVTYDSGGCLMFTHAASGQMRFSPPPHPEEKLRPLFVISE